MINYNKKQIAILAVIISVILFNCSSKSQLPQRGICAHRGASASHPENTIAAFKEAIRLGAQMIEFDVHQTKDGEPVIIHDATLDETTNGSGKVSDWTLAEIQQLDAGSWKDSTFSNERIPTFAEALAIMPFNIWLNIHFRADSSIIEKVVNTIIDQNRLHQSILACTPNIARAAKKIDDRLLICNMDRGKTTAEYVKNTIAMKADFIQLKSRSDSTLTTVITELKQHHIKINYYGIDFPAKVLQIFEAGVDFPLVNDVEMAMQLAKSVGIEPLKPQYKN